MKLSPYLLEHSGSSPNSLHIAASLGALHMYAIPVVEGIIWFTSIRQIVFYSLQFTDHNERVILSVCEESIQSLATVLCMII